MAIYTPKERHEIKLTRSYHAVDFVTAKDGKGDIIERHFCDSVRVDGGGAIRCIPVGHLVADGSRAEIDPVVEAVAEEAKHIEWIELAAEQVGQFLGKIGVGVISGVAYALDGQTPLIAVRVFDTFPIAPCFGAAAYAAYIEKFGPSFVATHKAFDHLINEAEGRYNSFVLFSITPPSANDELFRIMLEQSTMPERGRYPAYRRSRR